MKRTGFRERLRGILTVKESPRKTAATFSIGVFVGISPLIGLHTLMGLALAQIFRLNRLVMLSGVYVTNPWSVVPIYTFCIWTGAMLLGVEALPHIEWKTLTIKGLLLDFSYLLLPFVVGTIVVGLAASFLSYFIVRRALTR